MSTDQDTGAPVGATDPTVIAAAEKEAADAHMERVWAEKGEDSPEGEAAQERMSKADELFAKAPVTSLAGAAIKARKLGEDEEINEGRGLRFHQFKTLTAYLEKAADPLPGLWAEWQRIEDEMGRKDDDDDRSALVAPQADVERKIASLKPQTLEGVLVYARLLREYAKEGLPPKDPERDVKMFDNLVAGLEQLGDAS